MNTKTLALIAALALVAASSLRAADVTVKTVIAGLDNPCAVAVQPDTGVLFVSESGAGRVIRVVNGRAEDVIVGFDKDIYGKDPEFNIGPLGLLFLDKDTLVVGGGDKPDGDELLRVFTLPEAGSPALNVADATTSLNIAATEELKGEGNFYGLAATKQAIFVTCNGDDTKGWIARASIVKNRVAEFKRFLPTKEATSVDAPIAITISPKGHLVVGQGGEVNQPKDSLITFYNHNSEAGRMLLNLKTGLYDITGLAYGSDGSLYATDFAWMKTSAGGLFQLVSTDNKGKQGVDARKLAALDKPSALAVKDDAIYVTIFGTPAAGSEEKAGKLVKVILK